MEFCLDLNNLQKILELVKNYNSKLLPVIKGRDEEDILHIYNEGLREFGENRLNELSNHTRFLPEASFHFIAPLQSRKIREIMNSCQFIHTLHRSKEIITINKNLYILSYFLLLASCCFFAISSNLFWKPDFLTGFFLFSCNCL